MAESVTDSNDKVITDNPFMDELMYNCKYMVLGTILKNESLATENETEESLNAYEVLRTIKENTATFSMFEYTEDMIRTLGVSESDVLTYFNNQDSIPIQYQPQLLELGKEAYLNSYQELNNYYRMISGLPDLNTIGIYLTASDIPAEYLSVFELTQPIHAYTTAQIELLENIGVLDIIRERYPSLKYLSYLGQKSIDVYQARQLPRFAVLYVPKPLSGYGDSLYQKYNESLEKERDILLNTVYSDAYALRSDHYDDFFSIMIIAMALNDVVVYLPSTILNLDFFDAKSIKFFFESKGVKYFDDIPLKYQIRLCKNLNRIIKNKSCDQLIIDVCNIFDMDEIKLYKYYLVKVHNINNSETYYSNSENLDEKYNLRFLKVPIGESLQQYISAEDSYSEYNDVIELDGYWNGENDIGNIKQQLLEENFTIKRTEYMAIGAVVNITENSLKNAYFTNILFDAELNNDLLTISVPSINSKVEFRLTDIFCLMYALSYCYYGSSDNIMAEPSETLSILGFNFKTNMEEIKADLNKQGYSLFKLKIPELQIPEDYSILTFTQLAEIYTTNKEIRDLLAKQIRDADNYKMYKMYEEIHDAWMIRDYNTKIFSIGEGEIATSYTEYLKYRSTILYDFLLKIQEESNQTIRNQEIQNAMSNILAALDNYITIDDFQAVVSYFPFSSVYAIRNYIMEIIDFFKSINSSILGADVQNKFQYPYETYIKQYECFDRILLNMGKIENVSFNEIVTNMYINTEKSDRVKCIEKIYTDFYKNISIELTDQFEITDNIEIK